MENRKHKRVESLEGKELGKKRSRTFDPLKAQAQKQQEVPPPTAEALTSRYQEAPKTPPREQSEWSEEWFQVHRISSPNKLPQEWLDIFQEIPSEAARQAKEKAQLLPKTPPRELSEWLKSQGASPPTKISQEWLDIFQETPDEAARQAKEKAQLNQQAQKRQEAPGTLSSQDKGKGRAESGPSRQTRDNITDQQDGLEDAATEANLNEMVDITKARKMWTDYANTCDNKKIDDVLNTYDELGLNGFSTNPNCLFLQKYGIRETEDAYNALKYFEKYESFKANIGNEAIADDKLDKYEAR